MKEVNATSSIPFKYIQLKLEDGRIYRIDASKVAHDRAKHYGKSNEYPSFEEGYKEEYEFTICNSYELGDWLKSNMDWYDLDPEFLGHDLLDKSDVSIISKDYFKI